MKKILFCMFALCLCACNQKEEVKEVKLTEPVKAETKPNNDKYVYIDAIMCLHTDKSCIDMFPITYTDVSAGTTVRLHKIQYIEKNKLMSNDFQSYCSECTEVEDYEEIEKIVKTNFRQTIYRRLSLCGYNCGDTFEEFNSLITAPEHPEDRRWLYDIYNNINKSWPVNDAYGVEEFASKLDIPCDFYKIK